MERLETSRSPIDVGGAIAALEKTYEGFYELYASLSDHGLRNNVVRDVNFFRDSLLRHSLSVMAFDGDKDFSRVREASCAAYDRFRIRVNEIRGSSPDRPLIVS